jgi:hypothetical protein
MDSRLKKLIEEKNQKTSGVVRQTFAKKATDAQLLEKLATSVTGLLAVIDTGDSGEGLFAQVKQVRSDLVLVGRRKK